MDLLQRLISTHLFKAGIVPGILLIVILSFWAIKNSGASGKKEIKKFSMTEVIDSTKGAFLEILMPIGVLIGIYGGITTPSEAAAMTAFYILIIEFFVYKGS